MEETISMPISPQQYVVFSYVEHTWTGLTGMLLSVWAALQDLPDPGQILVKSLMGKSGHTDFGKWLLVRPLLVLQGFESFQQPLLNPYTVFAGHPGWCCRPARYNS